MSARCQLTISVSLSYLTLSHLRTTCLPEPLPLEVCTMWTLRRIRRIRRRLAWLPWPALQGYLERKEADLNWERKKHLWPTRSIQDIEVLGDS